MTGSDTSAGRVLGERYELLDALGFGGMAEVYRAHDLRLGRDVAVKVLRADLARDPSFQARFRREAQAAASLSHPSIVAVYDTGEDTGVPYIVMEYVDGMTLRDVLQAHGRLDARHALEIVSVVCDALDYSHQAGIVHRDVKPGNVMLTDAGDVKVMDFGIARALSASSAAMTQTAAVMGTAQYLSPEQARGENVDARSDIYSTGVLLYELLCGQPPFTGDSPVSVAYQHVREDAVPPSEHAPHLGPDIDSIVLMAMAKSPANRYQTAGEMKADIDRTLRGESVLATAVPLAEEQTTVLAPTPAAATSLHQPPADPERRRRVLWGVLGFAGLVVLLLGVLLASALVGDNEKKVETPNVIGMTLPQAIQALQIAGLTPGEITRQYSDRPVDEVLDQSPRSDIPSLENGSVDLVVSQGIEIVAVPDVIGKSIEEAEVLLSEAKLKIGDVVQRDDVNAEPGTVLETAPQAGRRLEAGSTVDIAVASGNMTLPNVIGLNYQEATQTLQRAGFQVRVQNEPDPVTPAGTVIDQDPAAGKARRGSTVTIVVAQTPTPTPTPTPTATAEPTFEPSPEPTLTFPGSPEPTPSGFG